MRKLNYNLWDKADKAHKSFDSSIYQQNIEIIVVKNDLSDLLTSIVCTLLRCIYNYFCILLNFHHHALYENKDFGRVILHSNFHYFYVLTTNIVQIIDC